VLYLKLLRKKSLFFGSIKSNSYKELSKCITQSLGSLKETKLYNKESSFVEIVEENAIKVSKADSFHNRYSLGSKFFIEAVTITLVISLIISYAFLGDSTSSLVILISVFGVAAIQLLPSINRIVMALTSIKYSYPSLLRIYDEIKKTSEMSPFICSKHKTNQSIDFSKSIELNNIIFSYHDKLILNNISLKIEKGKRVAFVGESGAGKTSLIDIILGLNTPQNGDLVIDGTKITSDNLREWQSLIGYIPQMIYLYDSDIRQNIAFGVPEKEINDTLIMHCLEKAFLKCFVDSLSSSIFTTVGENGIQLSGGQRQRLGIARALYRDPKILVMDEATAALDNRTEAEVTKALTSVSEGRTIITIAHRISTVIDYDKIYFIEHGNISDQGNYKYLFSTNSNFRKFVHSS
jgi:ATP-binding cassette subfamily C protein